MPAQSPFTVLVPVKPPALGKSRLAAMPDETRIALATAFAQDTITAALSASRVAEVMVVTDDFRFAALALIAIHQHGIPDVFPEKVLLEEILGGDPDDRQSLIRLLVHANEFDIEGLIASAAGTPNELKENVVKPELIREIVEAYAREQGLWHDEHSEEPTYSETLELDLSEVVPSLAGPKRPQDRVPLNRAKDMFRDALTNYVWALGLGGADDALYRSKAEGRNRVVVDVSS